MKHRSIIPSATSFLLTCCAAFLGAGSSARAALALANGDFEAAPAADNQTDVTGWHDYDSGSGNFWEQTWLETADVPTGGALAMAGGGFLGQAWAYQAIGTADGVISLTLKFDYGSFADATVNRDLGVTWSVYAGTGNFTPGQNVDVDSSADVTLLDSISASSLGVTPGSKAETTTVTLNLAGAGNAPLYLRVSNFSPTTNANDNGYVWVDNVSIVPEPSAAALLGLAAAAGFARRRRH